MSGGVGSNNRKIPVTNYWVAPPHKHRPQRTSERIDPTQHAKGRTGDCPGPRKETATRRTCWVTMSLCVWSHSLHSHCV